MTPEQQTLEDVKKEINALPQAEREAVLRYAEAFRETIVKGGPLVRVALALVGAELAAQE